VIFIYKLIAHRGMHDKYIKENTYDAIKNALDSDKFVGVEFDVRETLDKEFILYHDALYNNKLIKNTKYREFPKYVPKLCDILKIKSNKMFLIEIKNVSNFDRLIKLLNKYSDKNIYVMSFSNKIIFKMDVINRKYKLGILNYVLNTSKNIKKLDFVGILNSLLNDDIVNKLDNLEIFSYGGIENKKYKDIYYITDNK